MQLTLTAIQRLQAAKTRAGLAKLLEIEHRQLTYLLYHRTDISKYKSFEISKRSGGSRIIHAPCDELKSLQKRLGALLDQCVLDIEASGGRKNQAAHGFRPQRSIITNAKCHRNRRFVFNLDLADFFPTITAKRIRGLLINDQRFNLSPEVATTIAHIACHETVLPQGAPSSPSISNLIAGIMDSHLVRLAKEQGCTYTRYADDLTFSTNQKVFPEQIAIQCEADKDSWQVGSELIRLIKKSGFDINTKKTRMQYRTSRQQVTGLIVNKKVNIPAEYRRLVRAYVFAIVNHGKYTIKRHIRLPDGKLVSREEEGTVAKLHGMLGFIHAVDNVFLSDLRRNPQNYPAHSLNEKSPNKKLQIFRRFLFYTKFYCNTTPLIICEGKTDNVYIGNAAHQCKHLFPQLIKKAENGQDILSFSFMRYDRKHKKKDQVYLPNFSTVSILGAGSGGADNLKNIIAGYKSEHKKFKAQPGTHPVIIIVDNDAAGKKVFSTAVENSNPKLKRITGDEAFVNVFGNLYLVPIPRATNQETSIEDLFASKDIPTHINGKQLIFSNDNDSSFSGKSDFAYDIVEKRAAEIDWTGFHPLLTNICAVLSYHSAKVGG